MMADDEEVFVLENGIVTNHNVPLILPHDLQADDIEEEVLELEPHNQPVEVAEDDENNQIPLDIFVGFEGFENIHNAQPNGSATNSVAVSSSIEFDQDEILEASSPIIYQPIAGYVNEGYQTDSSELSELTGSNEIQPEAVAAGILGATAKFGDKAGISEGMSSIVSKANMKDSLSVFDGQFPPNPPNSPASVKSDLDESRNEEGVPNCDINSTEVTHPKVLSSPLTVRDNQRGAVNLPRVSSSAVHVIPELNISVTRSSTHGVQGDPQISGNGRPYNLFIKYGSFMVMLILLFPLAIVACLQGLLPASYLSLFLILWILSFIVACSLFAKACQAGSETARRTNLRVSYGSVEDTNPTTTDAE